MTELQTDESPHLTVAQLAARWQTTKQAIYIARHRGKAPNGFKRGRDVLFPIAEVEAFEASRMAADKPSNRGAEVHRAPEPRRSARRPAPRPAKSAA